MSKIGIRRVLSITAEGMDWGHSFVELSDGRFRAVPLKRFQDEGCLRSMSEEELWDEVLSLRKQILELNRRIG